ncbi:MAG TPA: VTT domain-containing protein [Gammaproteobacteria bacterium]
MKRINPIYLLIALNIVFFVFRDFILSEETQEVLATSIESLLLSIGIFGHIGIVATYVLCGFFFVPLLIPLNILGGALYGAYVGTLIAVAGVTLSTMASTYAARYVFTGMQVSIKNRPRIRRLLDHADNHPNLSVVLVRFMIVIPYLVQNIALAATRSSIARITVVTMISASPGAAIYSLLGAGLVRAEQVNEMLIYLALPVVLFIFVSLGMIYVRKKYEEP